MVVVSLILLGSFLQERLEEHPMYSLLAVSSPGGAPTTGRSFIEEFSQFRRRSSLTVRALRRKFWKNQERVRDRISAEPALTQSRGTGEEEGRAFTCAGAARTRPPGGPPGGHIPEPQGTPQQLARCTWKSRVRPGPHLVLEPTLLWKASELRLGRVKEGASETRMQSELGESEPTTGPDASLQRLSQSPARVSRVR